MIFMLFLSLSLITYLITKTGHQVTKTQEVYIVRIQWPKG